MTLPFQISREIANNFGSAAREVRDENTIERVLSQAMNSKNPEILQNSIGQILSQVSPERQGAAVQYLQGAMQNMQKQQQQSQQFQRERQAGLTPGINPTSQAAIYKEGQKNQRLQQAEAQFNNQFDNQNIVQPNIPSTQQQQVPLQDGQQSNYEGEKKSLSRLLFSPDLEVRERAKAGLKDIENREREFKADLRELRKETLPLKQDIIRRADASRESIRNKSNLIDLIDRGQINDPTFAIFAESLPGNLGKRLLSEDTVQYKGGLVDEFADLKNIFKGATRVKEVELYENKLADLYLTDSQKKAILKSRINTSKIDLIKEEAAQEVEEKFPNISALQFNKKVDEIAKPKINALFNNIWEDQKYALDQAENRKNIPLDYDDPEGREILNQILIEAGGNKTRAREIAKKKGYIIGK